MAVHDPYAHGPFNAYRNNITDLSSGATDVRCALLSSAHTPSLTGHETFSDVSANEVSGTGYSSGGQALDATDLSISGSVTTYSAADVVWTESTITAGYAVIYDNDSGNLLTLIDFEGTEESENGDFSIEFDAGDIFSVST